MKLKILMMPLLLAGLSILPRAAHADQDGYDHCMSVYKYMSWLQFQCAAELSAPSPVCSLQTTTTSLQIAGGAMSSNIANYYCQNIYAAGRSFVAARYSLITSVIGQPYYTLACTYQVCK